MSNEIIKIENLTRVFHVGSEDVHALKGISFSISLLKLPLGSGVTGLKGREKTEIFYPPGALRCYVWGGAGIFQAGAGRESSSLPQRGPGL